MPGLDNSPLQKLNEDVVNRILNMLTRTGTLKSFSVTCHRIRDLVMPFLFKSFVYHGTSPHRLTSPGSDDLLPPSVRHYVRSVIVVDDCSDVRYAYNAEMPLTWTDNALLCGIFPGPSFASRLRELPNLRSLTMTKHNYEPHGIPWGTVRAILSLPHLRELQMVSLGFCPALRPEDDLILDTVAPLTSFRYRLDHPRELISYPSETAVLTTVLEKLCLSLETLVLMSEPASLPDLARLRWPHLRMLVFYGTPFPVAIPLASLCAGMPALRSLSLKLSATSDAVHQPLWPTGFTGGPLPELDSLMISYPDPQDEVFDHLPPTLRSLSLRCWPHADLQQANPRFCCDLGAVLDGSAMLSILRRCDARALDHLEVEYITDAEDDASLLGYIAKKFPSLSSLKLGRHRTVDTASSVPVKYIARSLAPLTRLRRLKLNLDFGFTAGTEVVSEAVNVFAQIMGVALEKIIMKDIRHTGYRPSVWVLRGAGAENRVCVKI